MSKHTVRIVAIVQELFFLSFLLFRFLLAWRVSCRLTLLVIFHVNCLDFLYWWWGFKGLLFLFLWFLFNLCCIFFLWRFNVILMLGFIWSLLLIILFYKFWPQVSTSFIAKLFFFTIWTFNSLFLFIF